MTHLFNYGNFTLHSGEKSSFKIDCDALTFDDLNHLAHYVVREGLVPEFGKVVGIPTGGKRFAQFFYPMATPGSPVTLIVDDVYTTGASMKEAAAKVGDPVYGVVIFTRSENTPFWVSSVLSMFRGDDNSSHGDILDHG